MSCKNFSGSVTWKLRAPVPYRDARRMRNSVLSSVSRLYRDCIAIGIPDSAVFTTKRGSLGIRIPDSSSVSRLYRDTIAIRNSFCVPGWPVLSLMLRKLSRHSPAEGASAGFLLRGVLVVVSFVTRFKIIPSDPTVQDLACFGDSGCGGARLLRILVAAEACVRHLLKLKLARVACAAQEHHPIEQEYLIQWQ